MMNPASGEPHEWTREDFVVWLAVHRRLVLRQPNFRFAAVLFSLSLYQDARDSKLMLKITQFPHRPGTRLGEWLSLEPIARPCARRWVDP
jgi:hypothetical protein